ncbi:hypothetical protein BDZ88DRAFT_228339 [Geranomyces variabilis]|nr:hypothetical protein BDZ88DRAFT_228339 [Geranomyces variabilis]KAJ3135997.1 hypothetical protein HDU90_003399 [Geranomyces variabilis]
MSTRTPSKHRSRPSQHEKPNPASRTDSRAAEIRKQLLAQNHEIVRQNAEFRTRLRNLENQRLDLVATVFNLEARIAQLSLENKQLLEHQWTLERCNTELLEARANQFLDNAVQSIASYMKRMSSTSSILQDTLLPALKDGLKAVALCDMVSVACDMGTDAYPSPTKDSVPPSTRPRKLPKDDVEEGRLTPIEEEAGDDFEVPHSKPQAVVKGFWTQRIATADCQ